MLSWRWRSRMWKIRATYCTSPISWPPFSELSQLWHALAPFTKVVLGFMLCKPDLWNLLYVSRDINIHLTNWKRFFFVSRVDSLFLLNACTLNMFSVFKRRLPPYLTMLWLFVLSCILESDGGWNSQRLLPQTFRRPQYYCWPSLFLGHSWYNNDNECDVQPCSRTPLSYKETWFGCVDVIYQAY